MISEIVFLRAKVSTLLVAVYPYNKSIIALRRSSSDISSSTYVGVFWKKVHSYAKLIAETEHIDERTLFIIETAALTHDIGIHMCEEKYGGCSGKLQEKEGPALAEQLLKQNGIWWWSI